MGALGLVLGGVRDQFSAFKLIKAAPSVDTTKPVAGSTSKTTRKKQQCVKRRARKAAKEADTGSTSKASRKKRQGAKRRASSRHP